MRLSVLGPTYPLRGGISHYTTMLVMNLRRKHDVRFISYKKQYPSLLFPGRTQRDSSSIPVVEESYPIVSFWNIFSWEKAARAVADFDSQALVISWVNPVLWLQTRYISQRVRRLSPHTKIIFWCHNVSQHEKKPFYDTISKLAFRTGDYFIVTGQQAQQDLMRLLPKARSAVVPLPALDSFPPSIGRSEARSMLALDDEANVALYFGFVREYKGLIFLIRALPKIALEIDNFKLIIAGEFWEDKGKYMDEIEKTGEARKVMVFDEYIPNEKVPVFFGAADVVVLPYKSASASGIVQLAYHFGKPVITTNVGALGEAVFQGKTGYLVPAEDPDAIACAVIDFFKGGLGQNVEKEIAMFRSKFSWEEMVRAVEEEASNNI